MARQGGARLVIINRDPTGQDAQADAVLEHGAVALEDGTEFPWMMGAGAANNLFKEAGLNPSGRVVLAGSGDDAAVEGALAALDARRPCPEPVADPRTESHREGGERRVVPGLDGRENRRRKIGQMPDDLIPHGPPFPAADSH